MHAELALLDPPTAARLSPNDSQRIQRALEICRLSGRPMSELLSGLEKKKPDAGGPRYHTISLEPADRAGLHARIAMRFDAMLANGFLDEVRGLHARPELHPELPSMRCVGYRQLWGHLDGEVDLRTAREQGIAATRQLAKRQITWLRAQPERTIVECMSANSADRVVDAVAQLLPGA